MHEYAFDVKLFATIRIAADSPEAARAILRDSGQCMTITIQEHAFGYQNTEAHLLRQRARVSPLFSTESLMTTIPETALTPWVQLSDAEKDKVRAVIDDAHWRAGFFAAHRCWKCRSGAAPCVSRHPRTCEYPRARND